MDRWIREAIYIRKEQDKSMNRDEGSYQLTHVYDYLLSATWWRVVLKKTVVVAETSINLAIYIISLDIIQTSCLPEFLSFHFFLFLGNTAL